MEMTAANTGVFGLEGAGNVTQALLGEEIGTMVSTAESTLAE